MKKTYNINLNGQVFCIDDDACLKLQSYIDTLEKHYLREEGGKEIMADIESRIAELLKEALGKGYKQAITMDDIHQIIQIMGSPDVIIDEDTETDLTPKKRKLYRDTDESILGGVASGIAAYFHISIIWVRLAFVLLVFFYGMTIIAYIVLWIVLPAATTSKQKLEMKGENINVSNIEKNIRDTYDNLKKNSSIQKFFVQVKDGFSVFFHKLSTIFNSLLKMVFTILSIIGLLGGTFLFILIFWSLLYPEHVTNFTIYHILYSAFTPTLLVTCKVLLFLTLNIPLLLIIYISARYLFHFNWNKAFVLASMGIWFLAGVTSVIIAIQQSLYYSDTTETSTNQLLIPADSTSHKYVLNFLDLPQTENNTSLIPCYRDFTNILAFDSIPSKQMYLKAYIDIVQSLYTQPSITIQKKIRGSYNPENLTHLNNIQYHWKQNGNELCLDSYFKTQQQGWKAQQVYVTLSIPEGDTLVIHGNTTFYNGRVHMELPFRERREVYITS